MKYRILQAFCSLMLVMVWLSAQPALAAEDNLAFLTGKLKETSSFKVRLKAAVLLGRTADPRAVRPLCNALEDDNYVVRGAAARALGNLGYPMAVTSVEFLLGLVGDEEPFVRKEVRGALERLVGKESMDYFISALSDEDPEVRLVAVHLLSMMNLPEARSALVPALGDGDEKVRAEAVVVVKKLGQNEVENLLLAALASKDSYQVQAIAARLVGEMKITSAIGKLAELLVRDDVVPEVKTEVAGALALMKDQMNVEKFLEQLKSDNRELRDQAIKLLGIHGGRSAVDGLMGLLRHDDPFVRRKVVFALGDTKDPRAIPALEFMLNSEENPRFRELIQRTLRKMKH